MERRNKVTAPHKILARILAIASTIYPYRAMVVGDYEFHYKGDSRPARKGWDKSGEG